MLARNQATQCAADWKQQRLMLPYVVRAPRTMFLAFVSVTSSNRSYFLKMFEILLIHCFVFRRSMTLLPSWIPWMRIVTRIPHWSCSCCVITWPYGRQTPQATTKKAARLEKIIKKLKKYIFLRKENRFRGKKIKKVTTNSTNFENDWKKKKMPDEKTIWLLFQLLIFFERKYVCIKVTNMCFWKNKMYGGKYDEFSSFFCFFLYFCFALHYYDLLVRFSWNLYLIKKIIFRFFLPPLYTNFSTEPPFFVLTTMIFVFFYLR